MKKTTELDLIFTRDFSLFTCIFWRNQLLLKDVQKKWGISVSDQIINFNGKLIESYRIHDEVEKIKKYVVNLPLNHQLFSSEYQQITLQAVKKLQILIQKKSIKDYPTFLKEILKLWSVMYPGYMLANFLPGPYVQDFKKIKGDSGNQILKEFFDLRIQIEGIFESIDLCIREMTAKKLQDLNIDPSLAKFLTLSELQKLFAHKSPINIEQIEKRKYGYSIIDGKLHIQKSFQGLLLDANYNFDFFDKEVQSFKGNAAYIGKKITGKAFLIFLSHHINDFPTNGILVTTMTAPNFLPAMKKASAIVTDEGGLTCHAAIIARELKKPTLIATKIATKAIKNGDTIEVDTKNGQIKIIKRA